MKTQLYDRYYYVRVCTQEEAGKAVLLTIETTSVTRERVLIFSILLQLHLVLRLVCTEAADLNAFVLFK